MLNLPHARDARSTGLGARRHFWIGAAGLVLLFGSLVSIVAAQEVANRDSVDSRQMVVASSAQIASTLKLAIEHQQDLASDIGGFIATDPNASNAQFAEWIRSTSAFARYPELSGIGEISIVPASGLATFEQQTTSGGPATSPADPVQIIPGGIRPYYCLLGHWQSRTGALSVPPGLDFCQLSIDHALLDIESSGHTAYLPFDLGTIRGSRSESPSTVAEGCRPRPRQRRAAFVGWIGIESPTTRHPGHRPGWSSGCVGHVPVPGRNVPCTVSSRPHARTRRRPPPSTFTTGGTCRCSAS